MNTLAIIQARVSSTRLPGKIFLDLAGKPMLQNILERVSMARYIDKVVVATSNEESDNAVEAFLKKIKYDCFRGDLYNVLKRFYDCAKSYNPKVIVRITADNAFVDPIIIDEAIDTYNKKCVDYLYYKSTLPLGMCIEVFSVESLEKAYNEATDQECLEHVTPYIRNNRRLFKVLNYIDDNDVDHSGLRFTMDTREDYEFVKKIYNYFDTNQFLYSDILDVLSKNNNWLLLNGCVVQNTLFYRGEI